MAGDQQSWKGWQPAAADLAVLPRRIPTADRPAAVPTQEADRQPACRPTAAPQSSGVTALKRTLDVLLGLTLLALLIIPFGLLLLWLLLHEGRPLFHVAERMQTPQRSFRLLKLRTMALTQPGTEQGVSGGHKSPRISPFCRMLRRTRLDELPQLWNVLRGDMSFVGPRPPMREYVERFPDLYARVLQSRPGLTGFGSLYFHQREERLLAACRTPEETDAVYVRVCIPRKAQLDLLYQRRRSLCLDVRLMCQTILVLSRRRR